MERYTEKHYDGNGYYLICSGNCETLNCGDCGILDKIVDRLAAYEDTGLEPEEIARILDAYGRGMTLRTENAQRLEIVKGIQTDRLRELARADKDGKLPEYTIGDIIYDRFGMAWTVDSLEYVQCTYEKKWLYRCGHPGTDDYRGLYQDEILTRAKAEAALRREQDG